MSDTRLNEYHVFLDTAQRQSSSPFVYPSFSIAPIARAASRSYFTVQVLDAQIPFSFRAVNTYNSTLAIIVSRTGLVGSPVTSSVTLTHGNYNITSLLWELKTQLTIAMNALVPGWSGANSFDFTYSTTTNRATFSMIDAATCSITLRFSLNSDLATMFGQHGYAPTDLVFTDMDIAGIAAAYPVNVNPQKALYLRCDTLTQTHAYEAVCSAYQSADVLCKIPLTAAPPYYILFDGSSAPEIRAGNTSITELAFYLTTSGSFIALDLEQNWALTLRIREYLPPVAADAFAVAQRIEGRATLPNPERATLPNPERNRKAEPTPNDRNHEADDRKAEEEASRLLAAIAKRAQKLSSPAV